MRSRLQPEDDRRDVARLRGGEQIAGDRRVSLCNAAIEFITEALAQRLRGAADNFGDVVLTDTKPGEVPHLLAHRITHGKCPPSHRPLLIGFGAGWRCARRTSDPT